MNRPAIIQLISGPRNISTALMYSFGNRPDIIAIDEPFYAYYLNKTDKQHPGREVILKTQPIDPKEVINELVNRAKSNTLFIKNMAHHLALTDLSLLHHSYSILLLRDLKRMMVSYNKVNELDTLQDIGIMDLYTIYEYLEKHSLPYIIIESETLLKEPENYLRQICDAISTPFDPSMLSWPAGPIRADGIWAKYWYDSVHMSTGFKPYAATDQRIELSEKQQVLYNEALSYYLRLKSKAL